MDSFKFDLVLVEPFQCCCNCRLSRKEAKRPVFVTFSVSTTAGSKLPT